MKTETFFESCGVADLIVTWYTPITILNDLNSYCPFQQFLWPQPKGGCCIHQAEEGIINALMILLLLSSLTLVQLQSFEVLEKEILEGQKLQGTLTAKEVHTILKRANLTER